MSALQERLRAALADTPLAAALDDAASKRFCERRAEDPAADRIAGAPLAGLARLIATQPETADYLSNRSEWLGAAAALTAEGFAARAARFDEEGVEIASLDLEAALDALRLRRRDEVALAACADLGGLVAFAEISEHLSRLAESTTRTALALAEREVRGDDGADHFAVIGMGKVAGREFSYHSDLDLIFLFRSDTGDIARATRVGQRLINYLTTQTGAGIAYPVDTRLRPSGQQGMLVTSLDGYERYQTEQAETWEHLAMLRARPIAGAIAGAAEKLAHVRARVLPHATPPWAELDALRERVIAERAAGDDGVAQWKTGAGGLMDVDFLAGGGLLERGAEPFPNPPSVPAMLDAALRGASAQPLLEDYHALRRIEATARWVAGRGLEALPETLERVAAIIERDASPATLRERVRATRARIREAYTRVIRADSISALEG